MGGLCGACVLVAAGKAAWLRVVLGAIGGVVGAFAGYHVRVGLLRALQVPDMVIAIAEDGVAIGVGLLIVPRF
jgi:uncharacterized membrane protein